MLVGRAGDAAADTGASRPTSMPAVSNAVTRRRRMGSAPLRQRPDRQNSNASDSRLEGEDQRKEEAAGRPPCLSTRNRLRTAAQGCVLETAVRRRLTGAAE